jgi:hypothetical protein
MEMSENKPDWSGVWEGLYYLTFFIFATLFVIPNLGKTLTFGYYFPVAMLIYGTAGTFVGIWVFALVRNRPVWLKTSILVLLLGLVMFQLVTHIDRFSIPD